MYVHVTAHSCCVNLSIYVVIIVQLDTGFTIYQYQHSSFYYSPMIERLWVKHLTSLQLPTSERPPMLLATRCRQTYAKRATIDNRTTVYNRAARLCSHILMVVTVTLEHVIIRHSCEAFDLHTYELISRKFELISGKLIS